MSSPRRPLLALTVGAVSLALAAPAVAATPIGSDSATVSTTPGAAGRSLQLDLLDLTGQPLQALALTPGQAHPYRVQVTDSITGTLVNTGDFSVATTLNNLYRKTSEQTVDYETTIPSSAVSVSYPAAGALQAVDAVVGAKPSVVVNGAIGQPCTLLNLTSVLSSLGLAGLTGSLASDLCAVLGTTLTDVTAPVPLDLPLETLDGLADLPVSLTGATDVGAYTVADFANGIGATDPAAQGADAGTARQVLAGSGVAALPADLTAALQAALNEALAGAPVVGGEGSGALFTVQEFVGMLTALPGNAAANQLGTVLSQLPVDAVLTLLSDLTAQVGAPSLSSLTSFGASYQAFPVLAVAETAGVPAGEYVGTLTATLVQE